MTPRTGHPYEGIVHHGGPAIFEIDRIDPARGVYFASDESYAKAYGSHVHRCRVRLANPIVYDEAEAEGSMEIDREILLGRGHDGRIVVYDDGELDVVAFHPEQIEIVGTS